MNDRLAFLKAIYAEPTDDTLRLVFSDWLEDHGTCDRDMATAEFIRASCTRTLAGDVRKIMPRGVYNAWIPRNWWRLVPTLAARIPQYSPDFNHGKETIGLPVGDCDGRKVYSYVRLPYRKGGTRNADGTRVYSVCLELWKGIVTFCETHTRLAGQDIVNLVRADQPQCEFSGGYNALTPFGE